MIPAGRGNIISAEETVKMMGGYVNDLSGQNTRFGMGGGGVNINNQPTEVIDNSVTVLGKNGSGSPIGLPALPDPWTT